MTRYSNIFKYLKTIEIKQIFFERLSMFINGKFRFFLHPYINEIASNIELYEDPGKLLYNLGVTEDLNINQCINEFGILIENLKQRLLTTKLLYPMNFGLGEKSSFLIYCLIREIKPQLVIETGVANGISTFLILNAIMKNGNGKLYSIDISKDVGVILSEKEKKTGT
ncbi:O-methyltransferase [Saccharolobus islandicus]|uniref:Methyltransferase n=1 Tax=Saccharolobus islandicus (strain M.16.4 / Kamchatka \|nr:hypothetical protein [Sulfolobus islandicus]ACR41605.1 hypothetical protein M164_0998 [Sulfolobus islandicus M.16.4]